MLTKCPECSKDVSDKAKSCPNCGFPIEAKAKLPQETRPNVHPSGNDLDRNKPSNLNKTLSERITSDQSEAALKNILGLKFKELEPNFDADTLRLGNANMTITQVNLQNVADNEWLITVDFKEDDKTAMQRLYYGMGAALLFTLFTGHTTVAALVVLLGAWLYWAESKALKMNTPTVEAFFKNIKAATAPS